MKARLRSSLLASMTILALLPVAQSRAQETPAPKANATAAAGDIADFFGQMGDQIYEDCIFELSEEQLEVQQALIAAYVKHGAPSAMARQLAVKQIRPPKLSENCERMKSMAKAAPSPVPAERPPVTKKWAPSVTRAKPAPEHHPPPSISLASKEVLPQWDCAPNVDFVTIQHKGFERKLTGGEICNPFEDVVRQVPEAAKTFRLGYAIRTGRLFIVSSDPQFNGKTIAWAISGREACRNNPDPDCLAARAVGPLPPGEYAFAGDKDKRVTWGPNAKRMVAGIYLTKLWNRELLTPAQTSAVLARGNIAIHVRLKGEMSEACLGLGPEGWAYVSSLIKDGRAIGVNVYISEPHPQIAEAAPIIKASTFSLSSLFK